MIASCIIHQPRWQAESGVLVRREFINSNLAPTSNRTLAHKHVNWRENLLDGGNLTQARGRFRDLSRLRERYRDSHVKPRFSILNRSATRGASLQNCTTPSIPSWPPTTFPPAIRVDQGTRKPNSRSATHESTDQLYWTPERLNGLRSTSLIGRPFLNVDVVHFFFSPRREITQDRCVTPLWVPRTSRQESQSRIGESWDEARVHFVRS
jgi:hypothetical protein